MQQAKTLGLTLLAALSLSALIASTASAVEPAKLLPETAVTFTSTAGKATLTTLGGSEVSCESATDEGSLAANATLGPIHIMFKVCSSSGLTCTGLGEVSGTILVLGEVHLVVIELSGNVLDVGMLLLVNTVHITCAGIVLVELKGELLCKMTPANTKTAKYSLACEQKSAGDPGLTTYFNSKGEEVKMGENGFLTSTNHGTFEMTALKTTSEETFSHEIEIMV